MSTTTKTSRRAERLRTSPTFNQSFTYDGRPYIAKEVEPYTQYWLDERDRILLAVFSGRHGATLDEAVEGYFRLTRASKTEAERRRLVRAVEAMRSVGVLVSARDDTSRYTESIAAAYVAHRPFPHEIAQIMIGESGMTKSSEVLDLAGGPGDLALQLARVSKHVAMMELSRGFLATAKARAEQAGVELRPVLDSCNRLLFRDEQYDVVTISQALHWMDDVMVCRGLCRCLRQDGSFFVVQGGFDVPESHPLSYLFGARSVLGHRPDQTFAEQAQALHKRLTLLFEALDAPSVHRVDPSQRQSGASSARIVSSGARLFRQRRPMGLGFARAFLTPQHIAVTGQSPQAFWKEVEARCAASRPDKLLGNYDWSLLSFRRGGAPRRSEDVAWRRSTRISYEGPTS